MNIGQSLVGVFFAGLLCACGGGDGVDTSGRADKQPEHGLVSTLAGVSLPGYANAGRTRLAGPSSVAVDRLGNLYIADSANHSIRKLDAKGVISTFAGAAVDDRGNGQLTAIAGFADGTGVDARFSSPSGVALDDEGNVYVADSDNHRIRKITPTGEVTTLAGSGANKSVDNGNPLIASFSDPRGIAVEPDGSVVYVADYQGNVIRKIMSGGVTTLAGRAGISGAVNGSGAFARFNGPLGLALSSSGDLYVAEFGNWLSGSHLIRKVVASSGDVSTFAGKTGVADKTDGPLADATFNGPMGVAVDSDGNVYVADTGNHLIRKIAFEGGVSTLAGDGTAGVTDAIGVVASFNAPRGLVVDRFGNVFVADTGNHNIRKIKK